jgi:vitamin B12 transport system substrate-binding protein
MFTYRVAITGDSCVMRNFFILCSVLSVSFGISFGACFSVYASHDANPAHSAKTMRIITLAPHLTELVFLLEQQSRLVAVSDYSDYPLAAQDFPSVASYTGLDFAAILALQPSHIIAWQGGNKPQDIAKLQALGLHVLSLQTETLDDIATNIIELGEFLGASADASKARTTARVGASLRASALAIATEYRQDLLQLQLHYAAREEQTVFYYSWAIPLMSIGKDAWANHALSLCRLKQIFAHSEIAYPQVSLSHVLRQQPDYIINVAKEPLSSIEDFWAPHRSVINAPIVQLNPDLLHRFTPRILPEIVRMCEATKAMTL